MNTIAKHQLLDAEHCQLLVVDVQQKLLPALHQGCIMVDKIALMLEACDYFKVPTTFVEQYPEGLGTTAQALLSYKQNSVSFSKTTFSSFGQPLLVSQLEFNRANGRVNLLLVGCEAHVCLLQTALDALNQGYHVVVVWDGTASRREPDRYLAEGRLREAGCSLVSTEMVLFEWLKDKGHPAFSDLIARIK